MSILRRSDDTGLTLYVILRNAGHQIVIQATGAVEAYSSSNWSTYVHAASEQGATGYYYTVVSDSMPVGVYWIEWKLQAGDNPDVSDTVRASGSGYWDGANWIPDWAIKLAQSASPIADSPEKNIKDALADTNEIQAELADGGRTDLLIDGIATQASNAATDAATIKADYQQRGVAVTLPDTIDAADFTGSFPAAALENVPKTGYSLSGTSGSVVPNALDADEDGYVTVSKNGTARLCKRVYLDGVAITQANISSIVYSIYLLDDDAPDARTAVTGHSAVSLTPADVIFDTLQTDSQYGNYNFRHIPPIGTYNAFSTAGLNYLVEYTITPTSGQKIITRFRVNVT